jgi:hypothetical protein
MVGLGKRVPPGINAMWFVENILIFKTFKFSGQTEDMRGSSEEIRPSLPR